MPSLAAELASILARVKSPGVYCAEGSTQLPVCRLEVDGVGLLGLPIPPSQARELAAVAIPAPYGRGTETILDPAVRRCGQIELGRLHLDDPRWKALLEGIRLAALSALGAPESARAELYKLLVYAPGDFFLPHRDSEKAEGMFATLLVSLPCPHVGGSLRVEHGGERVDVELSAADVGLVRWAAFYADCRHELLPVTSGWRVVLVYNLVLAGGAAPRLADERDTVSRLVRRLTTWGGGLKVVLPLEHRYTPAELAFSGLKNRDRARAQVILRAAAAAECAVAVSLLDIVVAASAEWDDPWESDWEEEGEEDEEDGAQDAGGASWLIGEEYDRSAVLRYAFGPDGREALPPRLPVAEQDVAGFRAIVAGEPDSTEAQEATGNEGATVERTYARAALVIWPTVLQAELLLEAGWDTAASRLPTLLREDHVGADRLVDALVRESERALSSGRSVPGTWKLAVVQACLARPSEVRWARVVHVLARVCPTLAEAPTLAAVLRHLPVPDARTVLHGIANAPGATADPLVALLQLLATDSGVDAQPPWWRVGLEALPALLATTTDAAGRPAWSARVALLKKVSLLAEQVGDHELTATLARSILSARARFPVDNVLVPLLLDVTAPSDLLDRIRGRVVETLGQELPPAPTRPVDARRDPSPITCSCVLCRDVQHFLQDPVRSTWTFQSATPNRAHVSKSVAAADVAGTTLRGDRPFTLVLTKTLRSYEAQLRVWQARRDLLTRLGA